MRPLARRRSQRQDFHQRPADGLAEGVQIGRPVQADVRRSHLRAESMGRVIYVLCRLASGAGGEAKSLWNRSQQGLCPATG